MLKLQGAESNSISAGLLQDESMREKVRPDIDYTVGTSEVQVIAYTWALLFSLALPEALKLLGCLKSCLFKPLTWPSMKIMFGVSDRIPSSLLMMCVARKIRLTAFPWMHRLQMRLNLSLQDYENISTLPADLPHGEYPCVRERVVRLRHPARNERASRGDDFQLHVRRSRDPPSETLAE